MVTLSELFRDTVSQLAEQGNDNARFEAEQLVQKATGYDRIKLLTQPMCEVAQENAEALCAMVERRNSGEPLQYILGEWEFYGLPFKVGDGVLIPRQDTETLVELVLRSKSQGKLCADLCAGSGCIGITLAKEGGCTVHSYELSDKAFSYLKENITLDQVQDKVTAIKGDVLSEQTVEAAPMYDIIVSNPPYLTAKDMQELEKEVMHEPEMALFGGEDGLDFYREILAKWSKKLKQGGMFAVEIGMGQEEDVMRIFRENGLTAESIKDYCGIYRVVYGTK